MCRELDGLSHFFFSPLPVDDPLADSGPLSSLPIPATQSAVSALAMEDVQPLAESSALLLPPRAAQKSGKRAALLASEELTREDRRRLRRAAKSSSRKRKEKAASPSSRLAEDRQRFEDLRRDRRVTLSHGKGDSKRDSGERLAKSARFFSDLQLRSQEGISSEAVNDNGGLSVMRKKMKTVSRNHRL